MPFSNWPEQMRIKAMRSRWAGSILACTLKTKPVTLASEGSTLRPRVARACRSGACATNSPGMCAEFVEKGHDAKVVQRRTEKHRGLLAGQIKLGIKIMAGALDQLDFITQLLGIRPQRLVGLF